MIFGAICQNPPDTSFENQEAEEKIILLLRAHLVTLTSAVFVIFILVITPVVFFTISSRLGIEITNFVSAKLLALATAAWYLFAAGYTFLRFLLWFFNIYLVTNERLIDFDFFGFLLKAMAETRLGKIQDVTSRIYGPVRTFFNFGDVFIQTAGTEREFVFEAVPNPDLVTRIISEEIRLEETEEPGEVK